MYRQTNSFLFCDYKEEKWGPVQVLLVHIHKSTLFYSINSTIQSQADPMISIHIAATALHYGQACFEGLKAFQCHDKKVRIFRPEVNAERINRACRRICIPEIPETLFLDMVQQAVAANLEFVPPYGSGGALYIRPVVFGTGPRIGLYPADSFKFVMIVIPVSDYFRSGWNPVPAIIVEDYDRAAPRGVGNVKVGANYAADILPNTEAKKKGYPIALYLDSKSNQYIEEFSTSNFVAIDQHNRYVTPKSDAILDSVTNMSLMEIAADEGMEVQRRPIDVQEIAKGDFKEIGACGTAVVVTPVDRVLYQNQLHVLSGGGEAEESVLYKLYKRIRRIQVGEEEDKFGWLLELK